LRDFPELCIPSSSLIRILITEITYRLLTTKSRVIPVETASGLEVLIQLGSQTYEEDKATRRESIFHLSPFLRIIILGNVTIVK
jgi:hypothetical protein